jgi:hypothetical protein
MLVLFLELGFAAPGHLWWFLTGGGWAAAGAWRGIIEARSRKNPTRTARRDAQAARAREARGFFLTGAGSFAVLGALLITAFEPVFGAFGPLRLVVYSGTVLAAAATGLLGVALSAAGVSETGSSSPTVRSALRFCASMGWAILAGLALLAGDSLLGRPEGVLAALTVPAAATGVATVLRSRQAL